MKLPKQSAPIARKASSARTVNKGVGASDSCGCDVACIGACAFGHCLGYCV
jgi:hypothetical protein